ncbi:MAG: 3-hydroxyacyl-CoA dehydrogenase [Gammaproteobacteria bacterium]|nr:3-hydroxyacyl-CoA dehydrogenase [Gammaproteobacteria bacterium]
MSTPVRIERDGPVAVIVIDHPPVNALALPVRQALLVAIEQAEADPAVRALVVHGHGRAFIAGADLRELDEPVRPLPLGEVLARLEACAKPVVAALHGATLGGGAELALACHYRAAAADLNFGLPEVTLGLLPGAGATVRLPRAVGWQAALELMTGGKPIDRGRAQALGLVDRRLDGDLRSGTVAYALELIAQAAPPRRLCEQPAPDCAPEFFAEYRRSLPRALRGSAAVERVILATEACARLPFAAADARARELFDEARHSVESRSLRHLFFAERAAGDGGGGARPVARVAVIGAGTMGAGIAISLAGAGLEVTLIDAQPQGLAAGLQRVAQTFAQSATKGRISEAEAQAATTRVRGAGEVAAAGDAELVIEAVFENLAVKRELFGELGQFCRPGTVLATNTSTLDVDAIAAASGRPADVVGMHFFSPANIMRLVEIVRGQASSTAALATARAVAKRIGKIAVTVGNCFGFVGNRMLYAYGRERELMLLEGASPEQIDAAMERFGMAMGPNAVGDLAGLDIGYHVRREWRGRPDDPRFFRVSDRLAELGRFGQKTGRGFYRYEAPGSPRQSDPEVAEIIRAEAAQLGIAQRVIAETEIVERCVWALVNEGARILAEGIAASPADIDVIWCNGYGFPRTRGGPMFHADTVGLASVLAATRRYEREQGPRYWTPAPLLAELGERGSSFARWQAERGG